MNATDLIFEYICDELLEGNRPQDLTVDDDLLLSGLIDSMGVVRLIHFIEENLAIHVPPEDVTLDNFLTIRAMSEYVDRRRQAA